MEDKVIVTPLGTVSPYCKGEMNCPGFLVEWGRLLSFCSIKKLAL